MARSARPLAAAFAALLGLAAARASAGSPSAVRLLGTVVSSDPARSLAMVEAGGASRAVRVGGELDGATVVEIKSESVVLRRHDELETLQLASVSRSSGQRGPDVPASPASGDAETGAAAERAHRAAPSAPQRRTATPVWRRNASAPAAASPSRASPAAKSNDELLADLSQQARFVAVNDNDGKLRGVALLNVLDDGMLERLGLRSDDVVTSINGVAIDSSGAALREARGLDPARPVALGIERRGVPTTLRIDLRSLQH